jgi:hypothetical protein
MRRANRGHTMEGKTGGHNRGYLVEVPKIHSNQGKNDPGATQVSKQSCSVEQLRRPAAKGNFLVGQAAQPRLGLPAYFAILRLRSITITLVLS